MATFIELEIKPTTCSLCRDEPMNAVASVAFDQAGVTTHLGWICGQHQHDWRNYCWCAGSEARTRTPKQHAVYCPLNPNNTILRVQKF